MLAHADNWACWFRVVRTRERGSWAAYLFVRKSLKSPSVVKKTRSGGGRAGLKVSSSDFFLLCLPFSFVQPGKVLEEFGFFPLPPFVCLVVWVFLKLC